jgi:phosphoglycerol geranylgeranyltransferase
MKGRVEKYLLKRIKADGAIHMTLIDPERVSQEKAASTALEAKECGTAAIMVGGSTVSSTTHLDSVVQAIKKTVRIPVILFPNNITGITKYADAIWFMSLLNSSDPYFIVGAQVLGAPIIKKFRLEPIPLGYVIIGEGGAAAVVGRACPVPYDKAELAAAHALAAEYLGMHFVYFEAGSGAKQTVSPEMVRLTKQVTSVPLIVGGGIKTSSQSKTLAKAGASVIVTGTLTEKESNLRDKMGEIVSSIKARKN